MGIKYSHVSCLYTNKANGKTLELSSGKLGKVSVFDLLQFWSVCQ